MTVWLALYFFLALAYPGAKAQQSTDRHDAHAFGGRVALLIGNANYADGDALRHPVNDARQLADQLRARGFDVSVGENLTTDAMKAAVDAFQAKIKRGAVALLYFSGYGLQSGRRTYIMPVDAQIWTEADIQGAGFDLNEILQRMHTRGAVLKVAILDASRETPWERRFRKGSRGLAAAWLPIGSLAIYSASVGTTASDTEGESSIFMQEMLREIQVPGMTFEQMANRTRIEVSRALKGQQVPWIASSVDEDIYLNLPLDAEGNPKPPPAVKDCCARKP